MILNSKSVILLPVVLTCLLFSSCLATAEDFAITCTCNSCLNDYRVPICEKLGATYSCATNTDGSVQIYCYSNTCPADTTDILVALCTGCPKASASCVTADCFPATAQVQLLNGSVIPMEAVEVGQQVKVAENNIYSDVHMFTHRDNQKSSAFYKFSLENHQPITVSPGHYIYVGDKMKIAEAVMINDLLKGSDGKSYRVIAKDKTVERGLYNPQTLHGDIVVDGIVVSTYTKAVHPKLAHAALAPLRMLYRLGWKNPFGNLFDQGNNKLASMLPSGATEY